MKAKFGPKAAILSIQLLVLLYFVSSMLMKVAANAWKKHGIISPHFILIFGLSFLLLAVYAYFWQKVLKKVDLSVAYLSKGVGLLWTLLWSVALFHEKITKGNIAGLCLIIVGILLMNSTVKDEEAFHEG